MNLNKIVFDVMSKDELKGIISNSIQEVINKNSVKEIKEDELLSREETSDLLRINLSTLWRWTKDGKLSAYGIGNRVFYKKDELLKSLIKIN
jgi:excisionase family DNA binding protein